jgi:proteic killer suppression protein
MVRSYGNEWTRKIADGEKVKVSPSLNLELALARLDMLDAANTLADISPLRSVKLHPLKGRRRGYWAISINGRWRLVFRFENGAAYDVEIIDYHEG